MLNLLNQADALSSPGRMHDTSACKNHICDLLGALVHFVLCIGSANMYVCIAVCV